MMIGTKQTVFVGMSGGVDSSVAAALLTERGDLDVVGCYIRCWSGPTCQWEDDIRDARAVAKQLCIPFYVMNLEEEYREKVVGEMLREYGAGRTPNPDVSCNREIKFGLFLKKAKTLGATMIATGHHARRYCSCATSSIFSYSCECERIKLLAGRDLNKDQSYFLWTLGQDQLRHTLFPIGEYTKPEVRQIAKDFRLPTAEKKDSQGVCFIGDIDVQAFLREHIKRKEGLIVTRDGKEVGRHDGAWFYTIGQRQGLGIGGGTPFYVVATDKKTNTVTVGVDGDSALFSLGLTASNVHWVSGKSPTLPLRCRARIRYRQFLQNCRVYRDDSNDSGSLQVVFDVPQRAVTPGQSVVFYDGDMVLGGGVIEKALEKTTRNDILTQEAQHAV